VQIIKKKKVAFYTLGCKLNFAETSSLARMFDPVEYKIVDFKEKADIYIINTCTVTANADKKSRNSIYRAIKKNDEALIVAVGCYSQLHADKIAEIDGVDLVLGSNEKFNLTEYIDKYYAEKKAIYKCDYNNINTFLPAYSLGDRTRSFLKVQDGCDYFCTYCTIPFARGKSRNISIADIVEQAKEIAKNDIKEIVLTGVNIGDFGKTTNETFLDLLKQLHNVDGIERYRISSIEPNLITEEIIQFVASSKKFMPHFHIPLQSGCNKILSLMQRKYNRELFAEKVETILKHIPHAGIGTDVIVGFPGETEYDLNDTYDFLNNLNLSYLHVFTYSERKGTKSVKFAGKVSPQEKKLRSEKLHHLSEIIETKFAKANIGSKRKVLFENYNKNGIMYGYTDNYIRIQTPFNKQLSNQIVEVKLKQTDINL